MYLQNSFFEMIKDYVKTPGFYLADEIKVPINILRDFLVRISLREFHKEYGRNWERIITLM